MHAGAVVGAGGVDTLTFLHIALCSLPTSQAHTPSLLIHAVTAAQHRARICNGTNTDIQYSHVKKKHTHMALQYISWETTVTQCEMGDTLLSQPLHGFSKSSNSPTLFLTHTHIYAHTHTHTYANHTKEHTHATGLITHAVSIYSSTT